MENANTTSRAGRDMGGSNCARAVAPAEPSTLDRITDRILNAARAAQEIGHKLHEHADQVHGPIPENRVERAGADRPRSSAFFRPSTSWTIRSPTWPKVPGGTQRWPSRLARQRETSVGNSGDFQ